MVEESTTNIRTNGNTKASYSHQHLLKPQQKAYFTVLLDELVSELSTMEDKLKCDSDYQWKFQAAICNISKL